MLFSGNDFFTPGVIGRLLPVNQALSLHQLQNLRGRGAAQVKFLLYILLKQVLLPAAAENKVQDSILGRCQPSHTLSAVNLAPDQVGKGGDKADGRINSHGIYSFYYMQKNSFC